LFKKRLQENLIASKDKERLLNKRLFFTPKKKNMRSNGLRYLRWGEDGEAVQPEKR
jgi:hypothetical protein